MAYVALAVAAVFAALGAVLAAVETAVMLLSPGRVHRLVEAERPGSPALDALAEQRHRLRAASALVAGVAFGAAALAGALVGSALGGGANTGSALGAALSLVAVLVVFALAQALPRTLAAANPERVGLDSSRLALPVVRVVYPLARVFGAPWRWVVSLSASERPLSAWAVTPESRGSEADEEAEREGAEEALLEAVSDFAEKVVREVMVPRTDMTALPDTALLSDAVAAISKTGYTRLPVYHETVDDVRGVLYAKDLLGVLARGDEKSVGELAREPYFVPETKPVEELLVEMRERTHIAIVADEYGGTAGLITLEDLLEEIVGEISDEYDREEPLVTDLGGGQYRVDARLPVDDLNELFGTDIETEADSVGGLFSEMAGRIPEKGEVLQLEGLRLTVTELEGTRIRQLCVGPASNGPGNGAIDA